MAQTQPHTRLHVLLARASRRAVIFRRGPSTSVLLIAWDRHSDAFEQGQWFRGRIYDRRCDLSPNGALLVYFAAKYKRYLSQLGRQAGAFPTWTAICRPPYLTALALWPHDSAWNGGGLFEDDRTLLLNHGSRVPPVLEGTSVPPSFVVKPLGGPHGEDDTVQHPRRLRDGWTLTQPGVVHHQPGSDPRFRCDPPRVYEKAFGRLVLTLNVRGYGAVNGPWNIEEYAIEDRARSRLEVLEDSEWADWDTNGDLLFARQGSLFRIGAQLVGNLDLSGATLLADFRPLEVVRRETPPELASW
jgi:hypothetical protein